MIEAANSNVRFPVRRARVIRSSTLLRRGRGEVDAVIVALTRPRLPEAQRVTIGSIERLAIDMREGHDIHGLRCIVTNNSTDRTDRLPRKSSRALFP